MAAVESNINFSIAINSIFSIWPSANSKVAAANSNFSLVINNSVFSMSIFCFRAFRVSVVRRGRFGSFSDSRRQFSPLLSVLGDAS